ncbi:hypothetical protein EJ04DRAFT_510212 [Polyplosphaeria fusca]|uniref:WDR59/RTC1-like RING zinc finger domain-containing protein n=1 Tax=Polyplosphaeria fusca TaxID=682080 RepID=A0A9P4V5K8_9PLEO|nr:hypothetical protein EJ04DRAFT_510212 [Polyplosphaeria fusca]
MASPTAFDSPTFEKDVSIYVNEDITAASISPSGRDVVLACEEGLWIIDLDRPYSTPRHIVHRSPWKVADIQWSPFASRSGWIVSTLNQKAIVYNLYLDSTAGAPIQHTLHAHDRAITDINFSAHHPDLLATCSVDSFIYTWDLRAVSKAIKKLQDPGMAFADFQAGASQVKWNRKNEFIIASSHNRVLRIWDLRHGARPLTTLDAHDTKIYGIDWHRSDPTKILTCSLDKTIKLWDKVGISSNIESPCRVVRSNYPLLRARHTPFANGIVAMPQRGSSSLELYSHDAGDSSLSPAVAVPKHLFNAHEDETRVVEFLWRSRGIFEDGIENRDFQLVSWGNDRHLRLHAVPPDLLERAVGLKKGSIAVEEPSTTRRGAPYVTFRDGPPCSASDSKTLKPLDSLQQKGQLSSLLKGLGSFHYSSPTSARPSATPVYERTTMTAGTVRRNASRRVVNQITWMGGVTIGSQRNGIVNLSDHATSNEDLSTFKSDLAAEISHVGHLYGKAKFEQVDIPGRRVTISFSGPWGEADTSEDRRAQRKLVFLRMNIDFPESYPHVTEFSTGKGVQPTKVFSPLTMEFEKTTATIDPDMLATLQDEMEMIALNHSKRGRESLEAVIGYGLGEVSLSNSVTLPVDANVEEELSDLAEDSSSDEDLEPGEQQNAMNSSASNANMPLPKLATAGFAAVGSLVVVKLQPSGSARPSSPLRLAKFPLDGNHGKSIFEAFGRFTAPPGDAESGDELGSPASSMGSWDSSSSPSSDSGIGTEIGGPMGKFQPPMAWQKANLQFRSKTSHPSSMSNVKPPRNKSHVTIFDSSVDLFVPSKRYLAEEYEIFGDGPSVCSHNARVARSFGLEDTADVWELCGLILNNQVPLEVLPQQRRREPVIVLARRALVRIKRKDSGLDLQFDEADSVTNPKLKGRIKWGHHPVASWLIPALFDYYERLADTQMLAMLSCIFSEPAAREGATSAMARMRQSNLPMSMEAPAFSLDYFASDVAAWSLFTPTISIPSTPAHSRFAPSVNEFGWHGFSKQLDTYGSHGSSNGPWGSDTIPSEPVTPYSTGNTPPNLSRAPTLRSVTASHTPYSTSPEDRQTIKKAPSTNFANALASLSRPFANAISSSPPVKSRAEADLSTSAPTSGVTWGTTTFYSSGSNERALAPMRSKHGKRPSFGQADRVGYIDNSDSDSEYEDALYAQDGASEYATPLVPGNDGDEPGTIKVTLKNQDRFDDEASVSAPLLDMRKERLYHAWREQYAEMLGCWELVSKRAEILKFNGLISYFPPETSRGGSKAGSMHLALKGDSSGEYSAPASTHMSRTSTLIPPPMTPNFRRSPAASPRHFSFNPEAAPFTPGSLLTSDIPAPIPEVLVSNEQYLRLSIPATSTTTNEKSVQTLFDNTTDVVKLKPRPSISRTHSELSRKSISGGAPASLPTATQKKKDQMYSCSICWLRVSGRFYICPACGHVAHFECMDEAPGESDEGFMDGESEDCVVGCGCGCGFEEGESEMELFERLKGWNEKGGWLPDVEEDEVGRWVEGVEEKKGRGRAEKGRG